MLFNSFAFLIGFAPITLLGFFLIASRSRICAAGWLGLMSIVFYGWWNISYVPILLVSIGLNFCFGRLIALCRAEQLAWRKALLVIAISVNLLSLAYFKYADFFVANVAALTGLEFAIAHVALPLGISFYTFTQVAYLVDTYRNKGTESAFLHYVLFVTYFPHLIAGPIIHHRDVMPQFAKPETYRFNLESFAIGAVFLIFGLFKKCFLADGVAVYAAPAFDAAERGISMAPLEAWGGVIAYTTQLYFDFSGYSDMAVGLSLMLNIKLPFNFNSPYKAVSISDFWKRWHISLSTFLRDYVYIPLGGNRAGDYSRYRNLMLTMLVGGLWHGAGWTFVVWGGLHGVYLIVNHLWTAVRSRWPTKPGRVEIGAGAVLTFFAVVIAWVFFRATTFHGAANMLQTMFGVRGPAAAVSSPIGVDLATMWAWCAMLLFIATCLPNTQQFVARYITGRATVAMDKGNTLAVAWAGPNFAVAASLGLLAALALMNLSRPSEFLYFNF